MRFFLSLLSASLVASRYFEAPDFNVTEALLAHGVDVSAHDQLAALAERSSSSACNIACSSLKNIYGDNAIEFPNEIGYSAFFPKFYSAISAEVRPYCIFKPSSAAEVSVLVLISRLSQCPFAVKSGGHSAFAGAANIEGGITVSLEKLKEITLSDDKKTVKVQPGNNWGDLLTALSTTNVSVVAGRIGSVGVGGFTLGGGISFLTNEHGMACDNVVSYEVVTANGQMVKATPKSYSDLYWALRGGGNNFGIVTSFTFETHPLVNDQIWGGSRVYTEDKFEQVSKAWVDIGLHSSKDPKAGSWILWTKSKTGEKIVVPELYYGAPNGSNSVLFAPFFNISAESDTTKTRGHASYLLDQEGINPLGLREVFYDVTFKASHAMALRSIDIFYDKVRAFDGIKDANPLFFWQHVNAGPLKGSTKNGGNALNLDANGPPIIILLFTCSWTQASDDERVYKATSDFMRALKDESKKMGVENDWIYMNYASQYQDTIASYGPNNKQRLKAIAKKYDPTSVFQTLQPGYFKLDRAPVPGTDYFSH